MCLKSTMCNIGDVMAQINPTYDFTERIAVSLGAFACREFTRDVQGELAPRHWPKVHAMLASLKIATQIVGYSCSHGKVKIYLDRIERAIPDLPSTADSEEQFSTLVAQAQESLESMGCILAEADFSCLGDDTSGHLRKVVALLRSARDPVSDREQPTQIESCPDTRL